MSTWLRAGVLEHRADEAAQVGHVGRRRVRDARAIRLVRRAGCTGRPGSRAPTARWSNSRVGEGTAQTPARARMGCTRWGTACRCCRAGRSPACARPGPPHRSRSPACRARCLRSPESRRETCCRQFHQHAPPRRQRQRARQRAGAGRRRIMNSLLRGVGGTTAALSRPRSARPARTASGVFSAGAWPQPGISTTTARGPRLRIASATSGSSRSEVSPRRHSTGMSSASQCVPLQVVVGVVR